MAISYGGSSTVTANNSNVVITKPTGLSAGDIMIAHVHSAGALLGQYWTPPTGWTSLGRTQGSSTGSNGNFQTFWKTADSGDAAASNFSFSPSSGGGNQMGTILYITGAQNQAPTFNANVSLNSTTVTTTGITPTANNLLVLLGSYTDNDGTQTQSSYSITNSNPTWTEQLDTANPFGIYTLGHAFATATRASDTATGTSSITSSAANDVYYSCILSFEEGGAEFTINETLSLTESESAIRARNFTINETLTLSETVNAALTKIFEINETLHLTETVSNIRSRLFNVVENLILTEDSLVRGKWRDIVKSVTSWTQNDSENSTTWTESDKSD